MQNCCPLSKNMAEAYAWADLVVCRSGALTVAELSAAGLPAIFVPFPAAVDDHQTANARPMVEAGAATVMQQSDLSDESLASLLKTWFSSRDVLGERAGKARSLARPDALERITDLCLQCAGRRHDPAHATHQPRSFRRHWRLGHVRHCRGNAEPRLRSTGLRSQEKRVRFAPGKSRCERFLSGTMKKIFRLPMPLLCRARLMKPTLK